MSTMPAEELAVCANLPTEMLVAIFEKLDSITRTRCERVCKLWQWILRETPSLRKVLKLDFSHLPKFGSPNRLSDLVEFCLERLQRRGAYAEVVILTDESFTACLPWDFGADNYWQRRSVERNILHHVGRISHCRWQQSAQGMPHVPITLVLHRVAVDYWRGLADCENVDKYRYETVAGVVTFRRYPDNPWNTQRREKLVTSREFKEIVFDDVMVLRAAIGMPEDGRYEDEFLDSNVHYSPKGSFYIGHGRMAVSGDNRAVCEERWKLLRTFWLDMDRGSRDRLLKLEQTDHEMDNAYD